MSKTVIDFRQSAMVRTLGAKIYCYKFTKPRHLFVGHPRPLIKRYQPLKNDEDFGDQSLLRWAPKLMLMDLQGKTSICSTAWNLNDFLRIWQTYTKAMSTLETNGCHVVENHVDRLPMHRCYVGRQN